MTIFARHQESKTIHTGEIIPVFTVSVEGFLIYFNCAKERRKFIVKLCPASLALVVLTVYVPHTSKMLHTTCTFKKNGCNFQEDVKNASLLMLDDR